MKKDNLNKFIKDEITSITLIFDLPDTRYFNFVGNSTILYFNFENKKDFRS